MRCKARLGILGVQRRPGAHDIFVRKAALAHRPELTDAARTAHDEEALAPNDRRKAVSTGAALNAGFTMG